MSNEAIVVESWDAVFSLESGMVLLILNHTTEQPITIMMSIGQAGQMGRALQSPRELRGKKGLQ